MAIPRRTMRDIRTMSGKVDPIANSYMAYMQITCLEMEKARKGRERRSAIQRVETIDGRLRDIEAEKASLLRALAERGAAQAVGTANGGGGATPRSARGFKVRY